jgi:hypothetical protein
MLIDVPHQEQIFFRFLEAADVMRDFRSIVGRVELTHAVVGEHAHLIICSMVSQSMGFALWARSIRLYRISPPNMQDRRGVTLMIFREHSLREWRVLLDAETVTEEVLRERKGFQYRPPVK